LKWQTYIELAESVLLTAIQARSQTGVPVAQNKLVERTGKGFADGVCSGWIEALLEDRKVLN